MNITLVQILVANVLISLISLVGIYIVRLTNAKSQKFLILFVAFAGGTLMGTAFFHLIPEAVESMDIILTNKLVITSFLLFFLMERLFSWHHHHEISELGTMNIVADALHNFLDGVVIASAFLIDFNLGLITCFAVMMHEVPQEIGDFAVLLHSGFSVRKALMCNIAVASMAILGGIAGYYALEYVAIATPWITAFAAGGFIYIATTDLLPMLKENKRESTWWLSYLIFVIGILLTQFLKN